ncbi:hypothetical protein DY245_27100 [Streptomyces inhibens]|uniref:Beta-lactamase-related domain-containing protein n=1 Tax=Streptomyces inhibens TaxID=2293571 RepID=A0A371PY52_STRIH|nr:serine hydrolase [Streptomyces inhibens]REK87370.1 hypothetical protein DY245_27100 [Streptomyces inhibens]
MSKYPNRGRQGMPGKVIHRLPTSYAHDPQTGKLAVYDEAAGGTWSRPQVFPSGGDGLVSTADDYTAFQRMLLNKGACDGGRILPRASVELMTTDHLTPERRLGKDAFFGSAGGAGFGTRDGFGMAVRARRRDLPSVGRFGWDGGLGPSAYADPAQGLTGVPLTQAAMDSPDCLHLAQDFRATAYRSIDD